MDHFYLVYLALNIYEQKGDADVLQDFKKPILFFFSDLAGHITQ